MDVQLGATIQGELPLDLRGHDPAEADLAGNVNFNLNFGVDVSSTAPGESAGRVVIRGGRLSILGSIEATHDSATEALGPIDLVAAEEIVLDGGASILSASQAGSAGDILLRAPVLTATDAAIETVLLGSGRSGSIDIDASRVSIRAAGLSTVTDASADGLAGDIRVAAGESLSIDTRGFVASTTNGPARGGDVEITGQGNFLIDTVAEVSSNARGLGDGGSIRVAGPTELALSTRARIVTTTSGAGRGGAIDVSEAGLVSLARGARITSQADPGATAPGGDVSVDARAIVVTDRKSVV